MFPIPFSSSCTITIIFLCIALVACSAQKERFIDADNDGWTIEDGDCDDSRSDIFPEADEICDSIDNDCDEQIDEDSRFSIMWYQDADADGFGSEQNIIYSCTKPSGFVENNDDCDDNNAQVHPQAIESLQDIGIDNRCDGMLYTEEFTLSYETQIPLHETSVYVPNYQFVGPSFFFLGSHVVLFSLSQQEVVSEIIPEFWDHAFSVRDTELWYIVSTAENTKREAHLLGSNTKVVSSHHFKSILSMDGFFGNSQTHTGFLIQNQRNSRLILQINEIIDQENDLPILFSDMNIIDIHNAPDINGDGYEEVWIAHKTYGSLLFGGEELNTDRAWIIHYEPECTKFDFAHWEEEDYTAFCLQDHKLGMMETGSPTSTSELSEMTLLDPNLSFTNFILTDHYLFAQQQHTSHLDVYSSHTINPTQIMHNSMLLDQQYLALARQTMTEKFTLFILNTNQENMIFDFLGLYTPE